MIHKTTRNPSPTMFQNIIEKQCFTESIAATGGVEESTYDGFVSHMDRTTQVVGSTKERMARLQ